MSEIRGQCQAITNRNTRCSRPVGLGQQYCWQHNPFLLRNITIFSIVTVALAVIGFVADITGIWGFITSPSEVDNAQQLSVTDSQKSQLTFVDSEITGSVIVGNNNSITNNYTDLQVEPTVIPVMVGDFNIAVAPFSTPDSATQWDRLNSNISNSISREVSTLEEENLDRKLQVLPSSELTPIIGDTLKERAEKAQTLASEIGADIVIYGFVKLNV
jgi:hypothetical protein